MQGACVTIYAEGDPARVSSVVSYIGSTLFQMTPKATRSYQLASQTHVGPYARSIQKRLQEQGMAAVHCPYDHNEVVQAGSVMRWAHQKLVSTSGVARNLYPPVWANAPWGTNILDPKADMAKQISDADTIMGILAGKAGDTPATGLDPAEPLPRVEEGDPTSTSVAPHRKSVIKGLRDPKVYLAGLLR
jgi:hypothetical protein